MTFLHKSDGKLSNKTTSVRETITNINRLHQNIFIWELLFCFLTPTLIFHSLVGV
jgi:hypothetical protein